MKKIISFFLVFCGIYFFSCSKKSSFPNTLDGAKSFLTQFLNSDANTMALTMEIMPDKKDYFTYFKEEAAQRAYDGYKKFWDMVKKRNAPIKPKSGQTELLLFSATVEELKSGTGQASNFPGGYKDVSNYIKDGQTVYFFKFVSPGQKLGMSYDGLVYVNGRWVIFPKPWRALK